jgi:predicted GNAT family acetyltransferase
MPRSRDGVEAPDFLPRLGAEGRHAAADAVLAAGEPGVEVAHRRRFGHHRDARESDTTGQLIEFFRGTDELEAATGSVAEAEVVDVPEASRYELRLGGRLIGLAAYRRRNGRIALTNTEVEESWEGRGFGSRLAATALDDARREGLDVAPLCPFIAHYIERHPEYEQLVASSYRD